jgi:CMP-N,N'-diacetyllegionaminic acid synthase
MDPTILCIIPARSGSKGVINKNIKLYKGLPLIAWSIKQALATERKMRVIVSTDSENYAEIARSFGAETPFLRPLEISQDESTSLECVKHSLDWLRINENYKPDIVLLLQPTSPDRKIEDINMCLTKFIESRDSYDSLFTLSKFEKSPFKMFYFDQNVLTPLFVSINGIQEPYNKSRQMLPDVYNPTGSIYVFNSSIIENNTMTGSRILPYITEPTKDIDTLDDLY